MPRARRTAAALAVTLALAGCTGGDGEPDGRPDGRPDGGTTDDHALLGTLDLDATVGADVTLADLAPAPDGAPVGLLTSGDRSWLVRITPGADGGPVADVRALPAVDPDARVAVAPGGTVLVAGTQLLTVPPDDDAEPTAVPLDLGGPPTAVALDGSTLYVAREAQLAAVDVATGAVRATAATTAPVTHLALDGDGVATLLAAPREGGGTGAVLARYDATLRPAGRVVELVPERGSTPTALAVTADGVAVATVQLGEARATGRLLAVDERGVETSVELDGVGDSALGLAVGPAGRSASVALADLSFPAELVTVDLETGERLGDVSLCEGTGVFGATAASADGETLLVTGACVDADGPQTTAFLVG